MSVAVLIESSATKLELRHRGQVVIAGSHGGLYPASLAMNAGVRAIILNDAGVGLAGAGTEGIYWLEQFGIAAAAVDVWSARIGDGEDMLQRGILSRVNAIAAASGCHAGMRVRRAADLLCHCNHIDATAREGEERRTILVASTQSRPAIVALDSASMVSVGDEKGILVIGSHGANPGGLAARALGVDAYAVAFNDAGRGRDGAGIDRLAALDDRNIPAVAICAQTAAIGDAQSCWRSGRISARNAAAARAGAACGQRLADYFLELREGTRLC